MNIRMLTKLKLVLTSIFFSSFNVSYAEQLDHADFLKKAIHIGEELNEQDNSILTLLNKSEQLFINYKGDAEASDIVSQLSAAIYSSAGEHERALVVADKGLPPKKRQKRYIDIGKYQAHIAVDALTLLAKNKQIVMINEAHHVPQHRSLTYDMLNKLWQSGYRYLALEALNSNKYPFSGVLQSDDGYYTKEPMFALLINHAVSIGFKLVSYDSSASSIDERETEAAETIKKRIFDYDPDAKVIIHVGYSHINEVDWLASKLKALLNIDPLTVDQTELAEKSEVKFEDPLYQSVITTFNETRPFVLVDHGQNVFSSQPEKWDVTVFWPRTQYLYGKADWLIKNRELKPIEPSICEGRFPCLVEVYQNYPETSYDESNVIPLDRTVVFEHNDNNAILLCPGKNTVIVTNSSKDIIAKKTMFSER